VATVFNSLKVPSEQVAPDNGLIASFRYLGQCRSNDAQGISLTHVPVALVTRRVFGRAKPSIGVYGSNWHNCK